MRRVAAAAVLLAACAPKAAPPPEERRQVIEGLTLNQSRRGAPAWTLRSRVAVLREEESVATLEAPAMDFYREGKAVSRVTALNGTVRTDTHDVRLSSSVVLDGLEDKSRLTTDVLVYSSKTGRFHTDSDVEIRRPDGVARGRGLDANPDLTEIRIYRQQSVLTGSPR